MKYRPLFHLSVRHSYYADERCRDFAIEPSPTTQKNLRNHRCILKQMPDGIRVLIAADESGASLIPWPLDHNFTFYLHQQNPSFALFTDLAAFSQHAAPLFTNAGLDLESPNILTLTSRTARAAECLTVVQPQETENFVLAGRPLDGVALSDFALSGLGDMTAPSQFTPESRLLTADSRQAQPGAGFSATYPVRPRLPQGVFAEVEIVHNDTIPSLDDGPGEFRLNFVARQVHWAYYLVTDKTDGEYAIQHNLSTFPAFSPANQTDLTAHPDADDRIAVSLAEQYPDYQRLRFISDDLIPCRERARKNIQLCLDDSSVIEPLPNPALQNNSNALISNNGDPQKEASLFQIVTYFSQPFQTNGA